MKKNSVKEKIVDATIELIGKSASIESVTIRDIAAKAGVGVGLINYHFQTKENLINQCVQKIIGNVISRFDVMYQGLTMEPLDKLRFLTKATCTFLAQNQGISRISILSDLFAGNASDNTAQTIEAYLPVIKEIWGDKKTKEEIFLSTHILIAALQSAFLRRNVFMQSTKIDFFDK
ncbi:MAG TPA: TetR/AcrR family transcriptional regulator, partial [Patescibacteria group bacterium]|nr:TetR/AcrR family transcriptional regulator [Patescibacteria group bacterium]